MLITYCFCLTDLAEAFESPTGYPFIAVFAYTTGSPEAGAGLTCVLIVLILFSVTNYMASCSRQVFAFGRDKGLPFYSWLSKVSGSLSSTLRFCFCLLTLAGQQQNELPNPCRSGNLRLLHPHLAYQPWKPNCFQRHNLAAAPGAYLHLPSHHRMPPLASVLRRTSSSRQLESRPLRNAHQYHRDSILDLPHNLYPLSNRGAGYPCNVELGASDVCWRGCVSLGLLSDTCTKSV